MHVFRVPEAPKTELGFLIQHMTSMHFLWCIKAETLYQPTCPYWFFISLLSSYFMFPAPLSLDEATDVVSNVVQQHLCFLFFQFITSWQLSPPNLCPYPFLAVFPSLSSSASGLRVSESCVMMMLLNEAESVSVSGEIWQLPAFDTPLLMFSFRCTSLIREADWLCVERLTAAFFLSLFLFIW